MKLKIKDEICAYYTNSDSITDFMINSLNINAEDKILEPSAGEGSFIDKLLQINSNVYIDAIDNQTQTISVLKEKYKKYNNIKIKQTDTLFDQQLDFISVTGGIYDKIIGNPPYGAWQNMERRKMLKKKYSAFYVKETYALFLLRCIHLLKKGGSLSFIIPDTFMFINMHIKLRKFLLTNTKIKQIVIFPSKFFPGISFGYSNLSIITLERVDRLVALNNKIEVVTNLKSCDDFYPLLNKNYPKHFCTYNILQNDIYKTATCNFILAENKIKTIISESKYKLCDYADIVSGFYCGDNKKYIKVKDSNVRGAKGYSNIAQKEIYNCNSISGINIPTVGYIPYVKSAPQTKYVRDYNEWYIRWDKSVIIEYLSSPKARFQNSQYYFKNGIAVPMVKSQNIKASLLNNNLFDQSIVGVFPCNEKYLYYILALLNSDLINKIIHAINPTANNSANYLKVIPFVEPDEFTLHKIDNLIHNILKLNFDNINSNKEYEEIHGLLQKYINKLYHYD